MHNMATNDLEVRLFSKYVIKTPNKETQQMYSTQTRHFI